MINPRLIPLNRKVCKENLFIIKKVFDEHKIPFMLGYGTLLGAVRDKDFILWDNDVDLFLEKKDRQRVVDVLPKLYSFGFEERGIRDNFWGINRKDNRVDLYFFSQRNFVDKLFDRVTCGYGFFCDTIDNFYWLDKRVNLKFKGKYFKVFKNYRMFLTQIYGADYLIPQKKKGSAKTFTSYYIMGFLSFCKKRVPYEFGEAVLAFYRKLVK